ncbi:hypothetical protein MTP99_018588 [Tenebrio molitor]|nr:hypothetical protein MTP99_018588 [Tenebrio molitor]
MFGRKRNDVAWSDYDPKERRMVWLTLRNDMRSGDDHPQRTTWRRIALKNNIRRNDNWATTLMNNGWSGVDHPRNDCPKDGKWSGES